MNMCIIKKIVEFYYFKFNKLKKIWDICGKRIVVIILNLF